MSQTEEAMITFGVPVMLITCAVMVSLTIYTILVSGAMKHDFGTVGFVHCLKRVRYSVKFNRGLKGVFGVVVMLCLYGLIQLSINGASGDEMIIGIRILLTGAFNIYFILRSQVPEIPESNILPEGDTDIDTLVFEEYGAFSSPYVFWAQFEIGLISYMLTGDDMCCSENVGIGKKAMQKTWAKLDLKDAIIVRKNLELLPESKTAKGCAKSSEIEESESVIALVVH